MKLEHVIVRSQKLYSVGYNSKLKKYILECVVPWVTWYNRYYEISEEEYNSFDSDPGELDAFVACLRAENYASDRFLFSDKSDENSESQLKLRELANNLLGGE